MSLEFCLPLKPTKSSSPPLRELELEQALQKTAFLTRPQLLKFSSMPELAPTPRDLWKWNQKFGAKHRP